MKKRNTPQPPRQEIPVINADPMEGLSPEEAKLRKEGGWANGIPVSAGKTEKEIVLENILTFFNLVFVVMAVILAFAGSSVKNMTFLIVVFCNIGIGKVAVKHVYLCRTDKRAVAL